MSKCIQKFLRHLPQYIELHPGYFLVNIFMRQAGKYSGELIT